MRTAAATRSAAASFWRLESGRRAAYADAIAALSVVAASKSTKSVAYLKLPLPRTALDMYTEKRFAKAAAQFREAGFATWGNKLT